MSALALAGCSAPREVVVTVPPKPDPDQVVRHQAAAEIEPLLRAYDGVIAVTTGSEKVLLTMLRGQVADHRLALAGPSATASPSLAPSGSNRSGSLPSSSASASTSESSAPTETTARVLIDLERAAAAQRLRQVTVASPDLARLLASIAASNTIHVAQLRQETS